jgi:hypothetical protein
MVVMVGVRVLLKTTAESEYCVELVEDEVRFVAAEEDALEEKCSFVMNVLPLHIAPLSTLPVLVFRLFVAVCRGVDVAAVAADRGVVHSSVLVVLSLFVRDFREERLLDRLFSLLVVELLRVC